MGRLKRGNDLVHYYMQEMSSRVVAESGRPSDRFHMGKLILMGLKDAPPDFILQIDGGTGMSETAASVLERSVRCATCFRTLGLGCGDVIAIMAPNHVDLCIPVYAAMFLGITITALDWTLGAKESAELINLSRPKLIFGQAEKYKTLQEALELIKLDATIISFGENESPVSFKSFHEKYEQAVAVDEFKLSDFCTEENIAFLISTSGTTGTSKLAAQSHRSLVLSLPYIVCIFESFPTPFRLGMLCSPFQWLTAIGMFSLSAILRFTRLHTSNPLTPEHGLQLIRKYQPTYAVISPPFLTLMMRSPEYQEGDFTSFEALQVGGSAVTDDVLNNFKALAPGVQVIPGYGMTEIGVAFSGLESSLQSTALRPFGHVLCRLVDPATGLDIEKPNVSGELWMTGPTLFKGYHKQPEETRETLTEDGWLKTGDIFYKDVNGCYFFVERAKMLLKFRLHHVSPVEIESVIRQHPGVIDAAVTGIPDEECGDLLVACVVRRQNSDVTAQEIKDFVKDSLSDAKQLRGGVIFVNELPMTPSFKINRRLLREVAIKEERQ